MLTGRGDTIRVECGRLTLTSCDSVPLALTVKFWPGLGGSGETRMLSTVTTSSPSPQLDQTHPAPGGASWLDSSTDGAENAIWPPCEDSEQSLPIQPQAWVWETKRSAAAAAEIKDVRMAIQKCPSKMYCGYREKSAEDGEYC